MKKIILIIISLFLLYPNAFAFTLKSFTQTHKNNTELNAERENIKVSEEDLNISQSEYLPTLNCEWKQKPRGHNKLTNQSGGDASITDVDPLSTSITIEQTLIDFGEVLKIKKYNWY